MLARTSTNHTLFLFVSICIICLLSPVMAQDSSATQNQESSITPVERDTKASKASPRVVGAENISDSDGKLITIGDYLRITLNDLDTFLGSGSSSKNRVVLFVAGVPLPGLHPSFVNKTTNTLEFLLSRNDSSDAAWNALAKLPDNMKENVAVSVGLNKTASIPTDVNNFKIELTHALPAIIFLIIFLVTIAGFLVLVFTTSIIRMPSSSGSLPAKQREFSLARTQLAFWSIIVLFSFMYVWTLSGELVTFPDSTWVLLAISIGTTGGASIVDFSQNEVRNALPDTKSRGFLLDIISDSNGVSIHRFQNVIWTLVIGIYYLNQVLVDLELPDLNTNLLVLMGISNGTYLGLKIPERPTQQSSLMAVARNTQANVAATANPTTGNTVISPPVTSVPPVPSQPVPPASNPTIPPVVPNNPSPVPPQVTDSTSVNPPAENPLAPPTTNPEPTQPVDPVPNDPPVDSAPPAPDDNASSEEPPAPPQEDADNTPPKS